MNTQRQLDAIVDRFEAAWESGTVPAIMEFLPETASATPEIIRELICIDLERRWRHPERLDQETEKNTGLPAFPRLEQYLAALFNEVRSGDPRPPAEDVLTPELITEEYRVRQRWGDRPPIAEYLNRFPQLAEPLRPLLESTEQEVKRKNALDETLVGDAPSVITRDVASSRPTGQVPGMQIRCPHCQELIVVRQDEPLETILCSSCHSTFNLTGDGETISYRPVWIEKLGRFELIEQSGTGAFGTVWKANDTQLSRIVAIKVPRRSDLSADERDFFLREARAAAQLRHPSIVSVHEAGADPENGTLYIVSDFIDGLTLDDWLTGQQPTTREAAELCRLIARALQHAHERGVVHRDLKPSNIMLDRDGAPHVMDFGLALRQTEVTVTTTGQVLGTPAYMSPEQARGDSHRADARSDVYALGVILFVLLTGERPFRGNARMLLHQVLTEDAPSPRRFRADLPRDLETICLKCLEKEPGQRYQSAEALADELDRFLRGEAILARPISRPARLWRWSRRNPAVAGLAMVSLVLLTGVAVSATVGYVQTTSARKGEAQQRELAERGEAEAIRQRDRMEQLLYAGRIASAQREWEAGNVFKANALLVSCKPALRGWEHDFLHTLFHRDHADLSGHAEPVTSVSFSPDGSRMVSGSHDDTVRIWDVKSGQEVAVLNGHSDSVTSVSFSLDGQWLVSGGRDRTVRVWDAAGGRELHTLKGHQDAVSTVAFSPDSSRIVSGGYDANLKVWEAETGRELFTLTGHDDHVSSAAFSPDGRWLVSGSDDQTLRVWDAESGREVRMIMGHQGHVTAVAFSPDGSTIASGSDDRMLRLWDASSARELRTIAENTSEITCLAFSPNGESIVTGSADSRLKVWDVQSGDTKLALQGHTGGILGIALSPDGSRVASGSGTAHIVVGESTGELKLWDLSAGRRTFALESDSRSLRCVAVSPDAAKIVGGRNDGVVQIWDTQSGASQLSLRKHEEPVTAVAFSEDGTRSASGYRDGILTVWDLKTGKELYTENCHSSSVSDVAFNGDGTRIVSVGDDMTMKVMAVEIGDDTPEIVAHRKDVHIAAFCPNGSVLAGACHDSQIRIWDFRTGKILAAVKDGFQDVKAMVFSPDGGRLITGGSGSLKAWDPANGNELLAFRSHLLNLQTIRCLAFSPDGRRLISGSDDGLLMVWDAETGELLLTLRESQSSPASIRFSREGRQIISVSIDGAVRVWDGSSPAPKTEEEDGYFSFSVPRLKMKITNNTVPRGERAASEGDSDIAETARGKRLIGRVHAIFRSRCHSCHSGGEASAGLDITSRAGLLGSPTGSDSHFVEPGSPQSSLLWKAVRSDGMPLDGKPLSRDEKGEIFEWIQAGAPFPE